MIKTLSFSYQNVKKVSDDTKLSFFVCSYIFIQCLNLLIKLGFNSPSWWNFLSKVILLIPLLLIIPIVIKKSLPIALVGESLLIILFSWSLFFGKDKASYFDSVFFNAVFVYLPMGLCVYSLSDRGVFLSLIRKTTYLCHLVLAILFILIRSNFQSGYEYSMSIGYAILIQSLIVFDWFLESKKIHRLLLVAFDIVMILSIGSRGPIISIAFFVVLELFFSNINKNKRLVIIVMFTISTALFLLFYKEVMTLLLDVTNKMGINSRSLNMLINNALDDTGRNNIYAEAMSKIFEKPILGWGICCGRLNNLYPHNLFLEFMLSFGIPLGLILSIIVVFVAFKGLTKKNIIDKKLAIIMISESIILLFSDSFIEHPLFFTTLFLCGGASAIKTKRTNYVTA